MPSSILNGPTHGKRRKFAYMSLAHMHMSLLHTHGSRLQYFLRMYRSLLHVKDGEDAHPDATFIFSSF